MIRLGIVGSNFGRTVQMPAFRADPRCRVVALAGSDAARTASLAREADVPTAHAGWQDLIEDKTVDAVAIATLPGLQVEAALRALALGKPVFAEKPLAPDLATARRLRDAAAKTNVPAMIDFNFHQIAAWQRAKAMLDAGAIGRLCHVAVHWHVENRATQLRLESWKTAPGTGGGVLGNFVSHCFHYLEWFCGPIAGLSARLSGLPGDDRVQTTAAMALQFTAGPAASLSMSCASYEANTHRVEFYGEDGSLALDNPTSDYMRGFSIRYAKRPGKTARIDVDDALDARYPDGRIAPVARLAAIFLDAIETGNRPKPDFADGYRAQSLIDAAQRSHAEGRFIATPAET